MFTYRVPLQWNDDIQVGCRVIVQFGAKKVLTGVVGRLHEQPPAKYEAKSILDLLDVTPVIFPVQVKLFRWIADYYMCTLGEVLNVALPSGLKLSSESKIQPHPGFDLYTSTYPFSDKETLVLEALEKNETLSYSDVGKIVMQKTIYNLLKSLVAKEAILIFEEVKEKYKPKKETRVRIHPTHLQNDLKIVFDQLGNKPKQEEILLFYLQNVAVYQDPELNEQGLAKKEIMDQGLSAASLKTLVKNGILEQYEVTISRFSETKDPLQKVTLTSTQAKAKSTILEQFSQHDIVLLHGITGSGKTEIYIKLVEEALEGGSQVLYLLPEIALTTQIVLRLKKVFGDKMGVYHSKFSDNERVEVWKGVLTGRYSFVVGVRSAIFLPFDNLGLVIVDEEHESSYKQYDPAPRYNARDVSLIMAHYQHAKVLLGSATPSIESYYLTMTGKYGLVELHQRYGEAQLPSFTVADMIMERKKKLLKGEFSAELIHAIQQALDQNEQVIIFQNRRGYSPYIACQDCGWIPKCQNCAVSLTYHQYRQELVCHYCGYKEPLPRECEACGSTDLKTMGFGTEKLEEELQLLFPAARVQRMDLDTTRSKNSYETIIGDFEKGDIDLLVGTQMVSKGLDFDNVSLVGIFDIDRMLHFPDFRSFERTFQLTTQVSGRAGRRDKEGRVVIQAKNTKLPVLHQIINYDYMGFYQTEIQERQHHKYPPFTRLIHIVVKNKDKRVGQDTAIKLANLLREQLGASRILGPQEPVISKIRNEYLMDLVVKLERSGIDLDKVKHVVRHAVLEILSKKALKSSKVVFNVDPY